MLALGGQGGGVLTKWLVDIAEHESWLAQSTYVAGVAQRTGATVYCVEMFPGDSGRSPVFTPYPVPGDVDLVLAGEMAETGRAIQKGFVTPNISTLIASSHRVYSMDEKIALGDGIVDQRPVAEIAEQAAKDFICFDMDALAQSTKSVISAIMLGAIAGSGVLPFSREAFEAAITRSGRAVESNLRGFAAGLEASLKREAPEKAFQPVAGIDAKSTIEGKNGQALTEAIEARFPEPLHQVLLHGALRALDYQDRRYADEYLDAIAPIIDKDSAEQSFALSLEAARNLALQMCYEDTLRVASLKTRRARHEKIRADLNADAATPMYLIEYFHPRYEEFCDTLPNALGRKLHKSSATRRLLAPFFRKGRNLSTNKLGGFIALRLLARMERFRRSTFRFHEQHVVIRDWLEKMQAWQVSDYAAASALATCIELLRGYGDTYARGLSRYQQIMLVADSADAGGRAAVIRQLHQAALADEQGRVFQEALKELKNNE